MGSERLATSVHHCLYNRWTAKRLFFKNIVLTFYLLILSTFEQLEPSLPAGLGVGLI